MRALSVDHHHGLVLARKAKQAGTGGDDDKVIEVWAEVQAKFQAELEPHFLIEETIIAPALEACGESALVKRLNSEHENLRNCVVAAGERSAAELERFGSTLEQHIRFEERDLFETAQRRLNPDQLNAIAQACRAKDRA